MTRRRWRAALVALAASLASCDSGPKGGELVFDLVTPNSTTGAVVFTVTAAAPLAVEGVATACSGCQVFVVSLNDQEVRGVVTGALVDGPFLRVTVSDVGEREAYSGFIREVAARDRSVLPLSGYGLTLPR